MSSYYFYIKTKVKRIKIKVIDGKGFTKTKDKSKKIKVIDGKGFTKIKDER